MVWRSLWRNEETFRNPEDLDVENKYQWLIRRINRDTGHELGSVVRRWVWLFHE